MTALKDVILSLRQLAVIRQYSPDAADETEEKFVAAVQEEMHRISEHHPDACSRLMESLPN